MRPKTLSASAIETFEACPARFRSSYIDRAPSPGGAAAKLGTVVHAGLEQFILQELHLSGGTVADLHALLEEAWWDEFSEKDPHLYAEAKKMLATWWERNQDWSYREVVMTEVKERFELPVPGQDPFLVTYIWDRCDRRSDGSIEVIDYKSYGSPLPIDALKERIQPRLYALAAFIRFKEENPPTIWVTYDLLRHDEISVAFTREECIETWNYLQRVAQRVIDSDGTEENLNSTCRWCPRQGACETLIHAAEVGHPLSISDINVAAERRDKVDAAYKALKEQRDELDAFIMEWFQENEVDPKGGHVTPAGVKVALSGRRERKPQTERIKKLIGPDIMARHGKLGLKEIDALLKGDELDDETKAKIKGLIRTVTGSMWVTTKPVGEFGEEGAA